MTEETAAEQADLEQLNSGQLNSGQFDSGQFDSGQFDSGQFDSGQTAGDRSTSQILNAFTVDVEDYFQVQAFEADVPRSSWGDYESRVVANTRQLLELAARHGVEGTFFVMGWVAQRFPELVREIHSAGHEIGSHSYWHRLVYTLSPEEFRSDLRQSIDVLQELTGTKVDCFRAASFSITNKSLWALDVLAEEGINFDSSIFPIYHDRYGIVGSPRGPYRLQLSAGELTEFPASTVRLAGVNWPVAGGGYFRLWPRWLTSQTLRGINRQGQPFVFYIHPWEVDSDQPRMRAGGWKSRLRHYLNLKTTARKLDQLLARHRFGTFTETLLQCSHLPKVTIDSATNHFRVAEDRESEHLPSTS